MSQLAAIDLRKGYLVRHQGQMCNVIHWNLLRNDRRAFVQMKFRELHTGRVSEVKDHTDTRYEVLETATIDLTHSYREASDEVFYTPEGEEYRCSIESAKDALQWQSELYKGLLVDGVLVMISLPQTVVATVKETDPPIKGGGSMLKDAVLENGIKVRVSTLVAVGDKVRIDPETLEFKDRV